MHLCGKLANLKGDPGQCGFHNVLPARARLFHKHASSRTNIEKNISVSGGSTAILDRLRFEIGEVCDVVNYDSLY